MSAHLPLSSTLVIAVVTLAAIGGTSALRASGGPANTEAVNFGTGMWDIATRIDHLDIPGLPPAMVRKIAEDPVNAKPRAVCIAASADTPPPVSVFHTLNGACSYETWQAAGGSLRAVLVCSPPDGGPGEARVEVSGRYTASTFEVASETFARDEAGETQLQMRSTISGSLSSAGADCAGAGR